QPCQVPLHDEGAHVGGDLVVGGDQDRPAVRAVHLERELHVGRGQGEIGDRAIDRRPHGGAREHHEADDAGPPDGGVGTAARPQPGPVSEAREQGADHRELLVRPDLRGLVVEVAGIEARAGQALRRRHPVGQPALHHDADALGAPRHRPYRRGVHRPTVATPGGGCPKMPTLRPFATFPRPRRAVSLTVMTLAARAGTAESARPTGLADEIRALSPRAKAAVGEDDLAHIRNVTAYGRAIDARRRELLREGGPRAIRRATALEMMYRLMQFSELGHNIVHGSYDHLPGNGGYHSDRYE